MPCPKGQNSSLTIYTSLKWPVYFPQIKYFNGSRQVSCLLITGIMHNDKRGILEYDNK